MTEKSFLLYTASTPNGLPIASFLEDLKTIQPGIDYDVELIDILKTRHKEPWFLELNPNGRIPVLVDRSRDNFPVFETSAILLYLVQHYDKEFQFALDSTKDVNEYSIMIQWLFFAHGGIGPMQGQACFFTNYASEDVPYAKKRYVAETKRLYGVIELRLKDREYLAGPGKGNYTIADVKAWPWVRDHHCVGIPAIDEWPKVKAWVQRCAERKANEMANARLNPPKITREAEVVTIRQSGKSEDVKQTLVEASKQCGCLGR